MSTHTSSTPVDDSLPIESTSGPPASPDVDALVERATALARRWEAAGDGGAGVSARERAATARLASLVHDPAGVDFALGFVDKVARPEDDPAAARELRVLARGAMPAFLGPVDRALVAAGGVMAPRMPGWWCPPRAGACASWSATSWSRWAPAATRCWPAAWPRPAPRACS